MQSPLTVEALFDVAESQLCTFGDRALFVENEDQEEMFSLCTEDGEQFVDCLRMSDADKDDCGLAVLVERLAGLDGDKLVMATGSQAPFRLGFKADGAFVETVSSEEIEKEVSSFA